MEPLVWLGLRRKNKWERPTILDKLLDSPLQALVYHIFHIIIFLRGKPFSPPKEKPAIRIVCISDTHDHIIPKVPDGDLLIHCGDLTDSGTVQDIQKQLDWLAALPHLHKVVISGNHDSYFDPKSRKAEDHAASRNLEFKGIHYLERSSVILEFRGGRKLNIYGAPHLPTCGGPDNAFQYEESHPWKGTVPIETDVLITHTPPRFHRDLDLGCAGLLEEIWRVRPKLHVFGHVHWGHGQESVFFDECQSSYEAFMSRTKRGPIYDLIPSLDWVEALRFIYYGLNSILFKWLMLGPGSNNASLIVNAACIKGNTGKLRKNPAQVVKI